MNLLSRLIHPRPATTPPAVRPQSCEEAPPDDPQWACGWFDSSHDLQQGLVVREHASVDTLTGELPLTQWLELHLQTWRPVLAS